MLRLIESDQGALWDRIVQSYPNWDIYYLCGYVRPLEEHEGGHAFLLVFSFGTERLCYPVIEKDIAKFSEFRGVLREDTWFDWETPYGYGGPLSDRKRLSPEAQKAFLEEVTEICRRQRVVSQFIRFHPLLENQMVLEDVVTHKTFKDTIFIDVSSEEKIFWELDSTKRNRVRKAKRSGVKIFIDQGEHLEQFLELYRETMDRNHAAPYYYFNRLYYESIKKEMGGKTVFFYAQINGKIVSAAIFFYNDRFMHYHLGGSEAAFRKFEPTTLLFYEAACWGAKHGIKQLHMGGGNTNEEDSLFAFKKGFNRNGRMPFYIGKNVFIPEAYQDLLKIRQSMDRSFDPNNTYFIQYRKPKVESMGTYMIAEAGVNHNGSLELALKLVDAAKAAGADCVKFQTFKSENEISRFAEKAAYQKETCGKDGSQLEMVKKLELPFDAFLKLKAYCDQLGIAFLSTPFDLESVAFLDTIDMPFWKIPSGEVTNLPYLLAIARTKKPVVMSTGMCEMGEIQAAMDILKTNGTPKITLLHCNTEYPTPYGDVNLRAMETMRERFGVEVGYSDHTPGIEVPIAAAAMGAVIIEKHFTLDRNMEGPDHKASLEPGELAAMVTAVRHIEKALGSGNKTVSPSEAKNRDIARKSIVASRAVQKGETFTEENIAAKRPGSGISPMRWFEVLGTRAVRDFEEDELVEL